MTGTHDHDRAQAIEDVAYRLYTAMQHWHAIGALELGDDDYKYQNLIDDARAIDWKPVEYLQRRLGTRIARSSAE